MARRCAGLALVALSMLSVVGCERSAEGPDSAEPPRASSILVIGLDGLEWSVLLELLASDELPRFASLIERGSAGLLATVEPTSSPVIWTTIATGKSPERHGIRAFTREDERGETTLYTSADRTTKAIWNIASDHRRSVCSVGWWMTYPVEPIHGMMVAQTNMLPTSSRIWKGRLMRGVPGQVHPPERQSEVMRILERSEAQLDEMRTEVFGRFPHPLGPFEKMLWEKAAWAFRADATYRRIAESLLRAGEPCELMLLYQGGTDVVGHYFWRYYQPELFEPPPAPEQIDNLGGVIHDYYVYADRVVGELIDAAPPDTDVFVVSDHGMLPAPNIKPLMALSGISGKHANAPPGVLIAAGPRIRRTPPVRPLAALRLEDLATLGSVRDITPTLLALLQIPLGLDMEGGVLTHLLTDEFVAVEQPPAVATHDTAEFLTPRPRPPIPEEEERLEQLRALGYIGADEPRPAQYE